jgi:hypothetical protein
MQRDRCWCARRQYGTIDSMNITIEEALRMVGEKAAMLRFVADGLASARSVPAPSAFGGMSDVCTEIEELAIAAKRALDANALETEVERRNAGDR